MSRPQWSIAVRAAAEIRQRSETLLDAAHSMRCDERDSGGAQCTADRHPEHNHRYHEEDLP